MWGSGLPMCASLLFDPDVYVLWSPPTSNSYVRAVLTDTPEWGWQIVQVRTKPATQRHFPYGNVVEPDS